MKKQTQLKFTGYIFVILLLLFGTNVFGQALNPPTNLVATPGNTSVSISLTAPSGNIDNYQWSFDNGTTWVSRTPASTTLPLVINSIKTDTTYTVRVRAFRNAQGNGNPVVGTASTPLVFTTKALTKPQDVKAERGNEQLLISFLKPFDDGGNGIDRYQYSLNNGQSWNEADLLVVKSVNVGNREIFIVDNLTNGVEYTVLVRAVNDFGPGEISNTVKGIPATTPSSPVITALVPTNNGFVLSFNPPANNGGLPIETYEWSWDNSATWNEVEQVANSTFTITDLFQGTLYRIRLRAVNEVGAGVQSGATQGTTHSLSAPINLKTTVSDQTITIAFTAPSVRTAGVITDYEYSVDGEDWTSSNVIVSPVVINGLVNGQTYKIKLRAVNAGGSGLVSNELTAIPRSSTTLSDVQLFHNANVGTVSVLVDSVEVIEELKYQSATDFIKFDAGREMTIRLVKDTTTVATLTTTLTFGKTYQVFVVGGSSGKPVEFVVTDVVRTVSTQSNQVQYRFVHGITSTEKVTLERVTTSTPRQPLQQIGLNTEYGTFTNYVGTSDLGFTTLQLSSNGQVLGRFLFDLSGYDGQVVTFVGTGVVGNTLNVLGFEVDGTRLESKVTTSDDTNVEVPSQFTLYSNFPNPFNPTTNIKFDLPEQAEVKIQVVDVLGRQVMELNEGKTNSGQKVVTLDGSKLASGVYTYRVIAVGVTRTYSQSSKFTLIK